MTDNQSNLILVAGATGGVGQLTVSKLLAEGFSVRILTRNLDKAKAMFNGRVDISLGDIRKADSLPEAMSNVTHIIGCTGTTAFPSARWEFSSHENSVLEKLKRYFNPNYAKLVAANSPEKADAMGITNLVNTAPSNLKRFVLVSSIGIERRHQFPFKILNAFGVLDAKKQGEDSLIASGLPYTIIRPGRLIDGPYTSADLNTLLKATSNGKWGINIEQGDNLNGQTSRIDLATAIVESLHSPSTLNKTFALINTGKRPSKIDWKNLFLQLT
ncbi:SDR family oxidoreductase [Gloeothece verrucosa]|uniref:NmrA family protein n=1 Tax=Gloeothece verrucosa (strain PCC 7822) TaxID=497965 RepID=E0UKS7_GLOV7|nr:SDR family oxidoreductase [Gloeothece verrucosa]ADN17557.1 NmrA family protein [Gloeothece verrucosa PCC 7822]